MTFVYLLVWSVLVVRRSPWAVCDPLPGVGMATSLSCEGMPDKGLLEHIQVHNQPLGLLSNNIISLSLFEHPSLRSSFLLTAAL